MILLRSANELSTDRTDSSARLRQLCITCTSRGTLLGTCHTTLKSSAVPIEAAQNHLLPPMSYKITKENCYDPTFDWEQEIIDMVFNVSGKPSAEGPKRVEGTPLIIFFLGCTKKYVISKY